MRRENETIHILKNSLEKYYPNGFYKKIPDAGYVSKNSNQRFTARRGIDIIYYWNGRIIAIEAKRINGKKGESARFRFDSVSPEQINELIKIAENGGNAYVCVHLYIRKVANRIYFIDVFDFIHMASTSEKKSINHNELNNDGHIAFYLDVGYAKLNNKKVRCVNLEGSYAIGW